MERCYPALEHQVLSSVVGETVKKILQCQEDLIATKKSSAESQSRLAKVQSLLHAETSAVHSTAVSKMKTFVSVLQKSCDSVLTPAIDLLE